MPFRSLTWDDHGDLLVVRLGPEIDSSWSLKLADAVCGEVPNTVLGLVLDLTAVRYIDSAGISALLTIAARLRTRGQHVSAIVADDNPVLPTLKFAGVPQAIPLYGDAASALTAAGART